MPRAVKLTEVGAIGTKMGGLKIKYYCLLRIQQENTCHTQIEAMDVSLEIKFFLEGLQHNLCHNKE